MSLDAPTLWATQIVAAAKAAGVQAGTPVTDAQLIAFWEAVKTVDTTQLGKADVQPGSFLDSQSAPVTGTGGPVK